MGSEWKGSLHKKSKMENVGGIRTVQMSCCILRKCNVLSGLVREVKLMNDINAPSFKCIVSLVLICEFPEKEMEKFRVTL